MPTFVYMTRCDGCGHCVDICPSDIMHIDKETRRAVNIEPNMCWECYSCVKACPQNAIDVRGYADFAPMHHKVRVLREEEKGTISWRIKFRNGHEKNFVSPITTKPWGEHITKLAEKKESDKILEKIYQHQARLDFTCRFKWTENAVAIWDNRSVQHYAISDFFPGRGLGYERIMDRIAIEGDRPN